MGMSPTDPAASCVEKVENPRRPVGAPSSSAHWTVAPPAAIYWDAAAVAVTWWTVDLPNTARTS